MARIKNITATTLVEVLVALIILSLTLSVALFVTTRLQTREITSNKIYHESLCDSIALTMETFDAWDNTVVKDLEVRIEHEPYPVNSAFSDVTINLWRDENLLFSKKYLLENEN